MNAGPKHVLASPSERRLPTNRDTAVEQQRNKKHKKTSNLPVVAEMGESADSSRDAKKDKKDKKEKKDKKQKKNKLSANVDVAMTDVTPGSARDGTPRSLRTRSRKGIDRLDVRIRH